MTEPGTSPTAGTGGRGRRTTGSGAAVDADAAADRIAELERRLERLEGAPGLRERGQSLLDRVVAPEASTHFRNAGREYLLGMRTIVDQWIRRLDESEEAATGRRADRETIVID
jgi:hypothetical protein